MGKIVLLDELTINQIAAGEVIERPASVIKEMMENSIDAGATNITVEIKNGGISYIRIADNGKGIAKDDVEMAFERHATSKIRSAADLQEVKSMGFRGEALASIAAIANVELISKTEEEQIGTKIVVEGGKVLNIVEIGASKGTTITVRNLFYNTPVRYKFLKKDFTESGYIEDVVSRIALVHPEIAIKLINSGKTTIQTNGNGDLKTVIYSIYGKETAMQLLETEYEYEDMKVVGVVGKPTIARGNRSNQVFFVNERYVKDKTLTSAAEQAFKGLLPFGKFAFLVLNIKMPASKVDVNVHPAKLEVRFEDESTVFKAVYHAIKNALSSENIVIDQEEKEETKDAFKIKEEKAETKEVFPNDMDVFERLRKMQADLKVQVETTPGLHLTDEYKKMEEKYNDNKNESTIKVEIPKITEKEESKQEENKQEENAKLFEENVIVEEQENEVSDEQEDIPVVKEEAKEKQVPTFEEMYKKLFGKEPYGGRKQEEEKKQKDDIFKVTEEDLNDNLSVFENVEEYNKPKYKYIGIAFEKYIVLEINNELCIMDSKVAKEKILYENIKNNFYNGEKNCSQMLLLPDLLSFDAKEMSIIKDNWFLFEKAGFSLEEFGDNTIKVSGVPEICLNIETKQIISRILDEINTVARTEQAAKEEKLIECIASEVANKEERNIEEDEAINLLDEVLNLNNPFLGIRGKTTVVKMSRYDIERKFARK